MRALFTLAVFLTASLTHAQTQASSDRSSADQKFLKTAEQGNLAEILMGELAQKNAESSVVKQDAERMVTDHTKMSDQIKGLATTKGVTLPTRLNSEQKSTYNSLSSKTGAAFDKAYVTDMIRDHRQDIRAFEDEANSGNDPEVRALAQKALSTLQQHLQLWDEAAKQLGITTSTTGGMR